VGWHAHIAKQDGHEIISSRPHAHPKLWAWHPVGWPGLD